MLSLSTLQQAVENDPHLVGLCEVYDREIVPEVVAPEQQDGQEIPSTVQSGASEGAAFGDSR